jgi:hypothetical protein
MEEMNNAYNILAGKLQGKKSLGRLKHRVKSKIVPELN